jgi:anti-sigma factor RsiW
VRLNLFGNHVGRTLSAYAQGQLAPERAAQVAEHLSLCRKCRVEMQEISFGIRLAENLPIATAPDSVWIAVQDAISRPAPGAVDKTVGRRWRWELASATSAALLIAILFGWYFGFRERLRLTRARSAPTDFEVVAIEEHARRTLGAPRWELATTDIRTLRTWVYSRTMLNASIPEQRPAEDVEQLGVVGAKVVQVAGKITAEIGYEVNGQPVTLMTARLKDLHDPPQETRFSKSVAYRVDSSHGYRLLTWGSDGPAYVMVSNLPGFGQQGCFLCHTAPERRKLIRKMQPATSN